MNNNKNNDGGLTDENNMLSIRLSIASAFMSLWIKAYDALLHHGINVRSLKEYRDSALLDAALRGDLETGQSGILEWIKRVEHGVSASIKRKAFKEIKDAE